MFAMRFEMVWKMGKALASSLLHVSAATKGAAKLLIQHRGLPNTHIPRARRHRRTPVSDAPFVQACVRAMNKLQSSGRFCTFLD
jgi:hypothetical protein